MSTSAPILVHPVQRQNPLLECLNNTAYTFREGLEVDFHINTATCALFLCVRYHRLHPHYLSQRLTANKAALAGYTRRFILLKVDVDDPDAAVQDLNLTCAAMGWTLMVGWSDDEIATYLHALKVSLK